VPPGPSSHTARPSTPTDWDLAGEAHCKCWKALEPAEQPVSDRLIQLARIGAGNSVLDIATGIGEPALSVARHVGPSGLVIATDQSAAMLDVAASRARASGVTNIEFRQMDANAVDLPDRTVHAVVCRWGLMFLKDLAGALARIRRCLVPGGRLAAAVWSVPQEVPIITIRRSVMRAFDLAPGANDPFSLSSEGTLAAAAAAAGFEQVRVERMSVAYEFPSVEAYADLQRELHESRLASLRERSPEQQAEFWRALATAAGAYADDKGVVRMPSEVLLLSAQA
jgi:ubiquinone/menaquinone biosynthesis C-methylase UbiE